MAVIAILLGLCGRNKATWVCDLATFLMLAVFQLYFHAATDTHDSVGVATWLKRCGERGVVLRVRQNIPHTHPLNQHHVRAVLNPPH